MGERAAAGEVGAVGQVRRGKQRIERSWMSMMISRPSLYKARYQGDTACHRVRSLRDLNPAITTNRSLRDLNPAITTNRSLRDRTPMCLRHIGVSSAGRAVGRRSRDEWIP
ncbi:MAG: hypothetical protein ACI4SO_00700 [Muribaculaceae bacterium]